MASENKPGTGAGVKSRERVLIEEPRQYKVIFHNDDFTTMEFVTDVLRR
ncbi:MAG: ATP-dependent Clp protease adaptor ClpS, partial [Muribaculaceae bacterium]|nr:ATP-dependent Clp protease adaptor ClpS [Muribaculaceae bacterium]